MHNFVKQWMAGAKRLAGLEQRWPAAVAAALLWFDPAKGFATAILWWAGVYGIWNWRRTLAGWKNPVGLCFGLGLVWALLSTGWSFYPAGSVRDLVKSTPMVLAAVALPAIFDRPGRIWEALLASAGVVTLKLVLDLVRLCANLGWPTVLTEARYFHPYLYTHPNVSCMMAGLCLLIFVARGLAGVPGRRWQALLVLGIVLDLTYLLVLASRGPQAVFALVALAFPLVLLPDWRARLLAAVLAVAIGAGLWYAAGSLNPRFKDRTMGHYNSRDTIWGHAKLLADRQPVLGYGFGKKAFVKAVYENPAQRAPRVPVHYPHAHSYWLMLYFQGGAVGFVLWSLGWLALGGRLARFTCRLDKLAALSWLEHVRARILPVLLGTGLVFILIYGIGDFPDNVIRHAQFYLAGLAMALTRPAGAGEGAA